MFSQWRRRAVEIPLPWERLLWSGRPAFPFLTRERYFLTDFRLVRRDGAHADELMLHDIGDVQRTESRFDRVIGASTLHIRSKNRRQSPLVLRHVRRGQPLAALLELLSGEPVARLDASSVEAAIAWTPRSSKPAGAEALTGLAVLAIAVFGIAIGLHGKTAPAAPNPATDPIAPEGRKRPRAEIVGYMEDTIMPWARATLGPIKGGADRISCETCHGDHADARGWMMPAVAALPQPDLKDRGWEVYGGSMDNQMRNAIYGYLAESDKQQKAAYMREVVMPGMARLLQRPAYDFTRTYEYNRSRLAFGCYHCHRVD